MSWSVRAASSTDPLWQKAVEVSRRNKAWLPGATVFRIELLNGKGELQDTWEYWYGLSSDGRGGTATRVLKALRNGEDVTAKEREAQEKRNAEAGSAGNGRQFGMMGDDPFDPELQARTEARRIGDARSLAGTPGALYSFRRVLEDGSGIEGTAILDPATGNPLQVDYSPAPLPRGVFEMRTVLLYDASPAGAGFLTEARVQGVGGILFLRRNFRMTIALSEYWKNGN